MLSTESGEGVYNIFAKRNLYAAVLSLPEEAIDVAGVPLIILPPVNVSVERSGAILISVISSRAGSLPFSALFASKSIFHC